MVAAVTRVTWTLLFISTLSDNVITAEGDLMYGVPNTEETFVLRFCVEGV